MDSKTELDFIPLIYQDPLLSKSHYFIVFDVRKMEVVRHFNLLPNEQLRENQLKNSQGQAIYTLTRTSDVYNQKQGMFMSHSCNKQISEQLAKYQVSTQYLLKPIESKAVVLAPLKKVQENPANCTIEF